MAFVTCDGLCAGFTAGTMASGAICLALYADGLVNPAYGFFECKIDGVEQIASLLRTMAARASPSSAAKEHIEYIFEPAGTTGASSTESLEIESTCSATAATAGCSRFEWCIAELIILRALIRVAENIVGVAYLLKCFLRARILVDIRMIFTRELTVGLFYLFLGG